MTIDPILLEVLRNRLDAIADEMEVTLLKSAASPIVKEGLDASAALFNTQGETVAQAAAIPIHLGALQFAAQRLVRAFPPESMREGDAFLLNDPYDGGTHLPDITLAVPVFADGRVVALACTMCHHQDVGGRTPGSVPTDATELYQEGVIIPPTQLFRAGQLDENLFRLLTRNVRLPEVFTGDLMAQLAAGRLGGLRLQELFAVHGAATVLACIDELLGRAERLTRAQIAAIPDGDYAFEDWLDDDGVNIGQPVKIAVTLRVRGSAMTFDFTGSDPQVRGPFNSVPASTMSAVYYAVRAISDASVPNNGGCFRAVDAILPEGTIVNPRPPAPVSCRTATIKRIADTILGALVAARPGRMPAANSGTLLVMAFGGHDPQTGRPFVASELAAGGMGARPDKDGIDVIETDVSNCMNIPVESVEMNFPLRIPRLRLWTGSGGAGRFRGGLGLEKVFEATTTDVTVSHRGERFASSPWGLEGGAPGARAHAHIVRADGTREDLPSKKMIVLRPGDQLCEYIAGGAGYGDPLDRDPAAVLADLLDGKITAAAAALEYGVALAPDGAAVDEVKTKESRAGLRQVRAGAGQPRDVVKQQVAAHWDRRASHFDEDFGHSIRTPGERAAWDRILDLVVPRRDALDVLDVGCGTGFLSLELAARRHRVTGVDFAPAMIAQARRKAAAGGLTATFQQADAEQLPFAPASFDLVISRHLLWTLPHPEAAIDEWVRILRPGGRLVVVDGQFDTTALRTPPAGSARASAEYAAIGDQLPFLGGRPREAIVALLQAHGLIAVSSDALLDLVAAQTQRMVEEGLEPRTHRRYVVWGEVAPGR